MSESKSNGGGEGGGLNELMEINGFDYEAIPDLSTCVSRVHRSYNPVKPVSYCNSGDILQFTINSGSDFINAKGSYLSLDLSLTEESTQDPAPVPYFVPGESCLNLFREIRIYDRAGNVIEIIKDANYINNMILYNNYSRDYIETNGSSLGAAIGQSDFGIGFTPSAGNRPSLPEASNHNYLIPLDLLAGIFRTGKLLPPQLMSGMRIDLVLESDHLKIATWGTVSNPFDGGALLPIKSESNIALTNSKLVLDTCTQADSISRALNSRASSSGLEIVYRNWSVCAQETNLVADTQISLTCNKAMSRAFKAFGHSQSTASTYNRPSFSNSQWNWVKWQWRAGNQYFPQLPETGPTTATLLPGYFYSLEAWHRAMKDKAAPITLSDFQSPAGVYRTQQGLLAINLERNYEEGGISGIPLNNSKVLTLNSTLGPVVPDPLTVKVFIEHLKLVRVFMSNIEIEE